jgi:DNA-3-methyladenine glycosylase II
MMACQKTFTLSCKTPFSFYRSLRTLALRGADGCDRVAEGSFRRLLDLRGQLVLIEISGSGKNTERLKGRVLAPAEGLPRDRVAEVKRTVRRMLFLGLDLEAFYSAMRRSDPGIYKNYIAPSRGLKPAGHPSLFETLVWGVAGQQVTAGFAMELSRRVADRFGRRLEVDGEEYLAFPTAERMSKAHWSELRKLQFSRRKGEYIIGLAKACVSGELSEGAIEKLDDDSVHDLLVSQRGIGEATASGMMISGLGRMSRVPLGDLGVQKALHEIHGLPERPKPDDVARLTSHWHPWGGLVAWYLWFGGKRTE